jgi:transposase
MKYVGLDLHLKTTFGTVMEDDGAVLKQGRFPTTEEDLGDFLGGIDGAKIALESSGFCMPWVEFLEDMGFEVFVAHPSKVKVIAEARIKTDKIDSEALAHLLRLDYLPCSYIPPRDIRRLREMARHRVKLGKVKRDVKNRIWSILRKRRIELDVSPFTLDGRMELRDLGIPELDDHLDIFETVQERIKRAEKEISLEAEITREVDLLTTIPGIGPYTALLVYSEIGEIGRFPSAEKLCRYAGLVPSVDQSGPRTRRGKIAKDGSKLLRWALVEAVWVHLRYDTHLTRYFHRLARRKGKDGRKQAAVATARKMLHVIYAMLRDGRSFDPDYLGKGRV